MKYIDNLTIVYEHSNILNMALTKQDLDAIEVILDKKLSLNLTPVYEEIHELSNDVKALREQIQQIAVQG
ncbi:MAG: hypothetical protein Q8P07_06295 [bacterium]|nr:hypothetical protein [bacterium]